MTQPRIAVVGCGYWGKNLVRNFAELGVLACLCDEREEALQAQAALYPGVRVAGDLDEVLADADIDAVAFATPAALHYDHVKRALAAGKDTFVEKPLALRYEHGVELVDLAAADDRVLMVGHILEFHPAVVKLKELLLAGELGELRYLYSNRANLGKVRNEENILWSFAPHDISVICSLVGSAPEEVTAVGGSWLQPGVVDVTTTTMAFSQGVRAHIFVSWLHPFKEQRLVVIGDRKMAVFDDTVTEGKLRIYDKGIEWKEGAPVVRHTAETVLFLEKAEPLKAECQHFVDCVRDRARPLTDGVNGVRALKVLEASQLSLERQGAPVALSEIDARVAS